MIRTIYSSLCGILILAAALTPVVLLFVEGPPYRTQHDTEQRTESGAVVRAVIRQLHRA